jgi:hypothetical protein
VWDLAAPHDPSGDYAGILQGLLSQANDLIASVRLFDGDPYVDAIRFRIRSSAVPGEEFDTQPIFIDSTTPAVVTLPNGTWRVQFAGNVRSEATAPGAIIGFSIALGGVTEANQLIGRVAASDGDEIDVVMRFKTTNDLLVVSGPTVLTIGNTTSSTESLDGLVRCFPAE